jgi:DNA-binding LacI/PurR family transcriptional regulator
MSKRPISSGTPDSAPSPVKATGLSIFSQVAAKVGVTPAAVTLAMQDSPSISAGTKQRVFWASRQLGYRASRAKQKQLLNIAVIVGVGDTSGTLQSSRNVEIWEGVSSYAEDNEMSLHTYILPPPGK